MMKTGSLTSRWWVQFHGWERTGPGIWPSAWPSLVTPLWASSFALWGPRLFRLNEKIHVKHLVSSEQQYLNGKTVHGSLKICKSLHFVRMFIFQKGGFMAFLRFSNKSRLPQVRSTAMHSSCSECRRRTKIWMHHKQNYYKSDMKRIIHQYKRVELRNWRLPWE